MGVTYTQAKSVVSDFISKKNLKVLALKGEWGVGKTHLLRESLAQKDYYYASVFGLSSIDQVKNRLITSKTNRNNWKDKFSKIANSVSFKEDSRIGTATISGAALSGSIDLALNLYFSSLRNSIFCLDDLERKSDLGTTEIIGLIDYLANELESQVVVIFNESELKKEESSLCISELSEKVFDIEVELSPSVEESVDIAVGNSSEHKEIILGILEATRTNNIRVIKKAKWMSEQIDNLESIPGDLFKRQLIKNLVLLCCGQYDTKCSVSATEILALPRLEQEAIQKIRDAAVRRQELAYKNAPSLLDNPKDKSYQEEGLADDNSAYRQSIKCLVNAAGFVHLNINNCLFELVDSHFLDKDKFSLEIQALDQYAVDSEVEDKIFKIHELAYSDLSDTRKEVKEEIVNLLQSEKIHPANWHYANLREAAESLEIDIRSYEEEAWRKSLHQQDSISALQKMKGQVSELAFKEMIEKRVNVLMSELNLHDFIESIDKSPWFELEKEILNSFSETDYYHWAQEKNCNFFEQAKKILSLKNEAAENLEKALRKISQKDKFYEHRVQRMLSLDSQFQS